jgi:IS605 OrfB family transposase
VNNLAVCTSNQALKPIILNGRPLKSINQFYNKKRAEMQSKLQNKFTSKKISKLTFKRNNKIQDFIHKSSRLIVNYCIENEIDTIIIGKNDNWKQNINIGKQNNQNFVSIPHAKFINLIQYKAQLEGIKVILTEESYTSKCSSLDLEKVCKHETYKGTRIKRGLFQSSNKLINADVNGSLNIMRKVVDDETFKECLQSIEGLVFNPIKINLF